MIILRNEKPRLTSTSETIEAMFQGLIENIADVTSDQFDECISFAQQQGWEVWGAAFADWKSQGYITLFDENEEPE